MQITPAIPQMARRANSAPAPQPNPNPEPQDKVEIDDRPPLAKALGSLPRYAQGAVLGVVGFSLPQIGGMAFSYPGAIAGGALTAGFYKGLGVSTPEAIRTAIWPTILGALTASAHATPTPLRVGLVVGCGAALGMLGTWRNDMEDKARNA